MGKAPACPCEAVLAAPSVGVGFLGCHGFLAGQAIEGFRYRFRRHCRTLGLEWKTLDKVRHLKT